MNTIELPKSLNSKNAILKILILFNFLDIKKNDKNWEIISTKDLSADDFHEIKGNLFQIEECFFIEEKFAPIREILYKKAFSPINND